jgi:hypothetical protein
MTLDEKLHEASRYLQSILKVYAPKDTGNLSLNAIRIVQIAPSKYQIIIGGEIAPYAVYTNAEWNAPRWAGKRNPNQNWVNRAIESAKPFLINILSGGVTLSEIEQQLFTSRTQLQEQLNLLAEGVDDDA